MKTHLHEDTLVSGEISCAVVGADGHWVLSPSLTLFVLARPRITVRPAVVTSTSGHRVRLTCSAVVPAPAPTDNHTHLPEPPDITWYRNGQKVSENGEQWWASCQTHRRLMVGMPILIGVCQLQKVKSVFEQSLIIVIPDSQTVICRQ